MLDAIADYLVGEGLGTLAEDLFIGQLPDEPDAAIAVFGYPGRPPSFDHDSPQPATRYPRLQVLCRDLSQPLALGRAQAVYSALCAVVNAEMGAEAFGRITPLQEPFLMRIDGSERTVVACNYEVALF